MEQNYQKRADTILRDYPNKDIVDLAKWCGYLTKIGYIISALIVLAHVIWYFAARSILAWPPEVYLWNFIIYPGIGLFAVSFLADRLVCASGVPLPVKEFIALSIYLVFSLYLSLTHDIASVLLCSYMLPIFGSTLFSNKKLTRWIVAFSMVAVLLSGLKMYYTGKMDNNMIMAIYVACFMFLCSYFMVMVLIRFGQSNLNALMKATEEAWNNELAFLQMQIKPHFLYNTLNTVVSFCHTDGERAARLLVDFSKYLKLVFDFDNKGRKIPLAREISVIEAYVDIEKARFGDAIRVEYDIDPQLLDVRIPSFSIQPLVGNAIKHGLRNKKNGGVVVLSVKKQDGFLVIMVKDTGAGMSPEKLAQLKNPDNSVDGIGFSNVRRRVTGWEAGQIDIQSIEGQGTTVTIKIPERTIERVVRHAESNDR